MSFHDYNGFLPPHIGSSSEDRLTQLINDQSNTIQQLQEQISSRDQALQSLLIKVNNLHVEPNNHTPKSTKHKGKSSEKNLQRRKSFNGTKKKQEKKSLAQDSSNVKSKSKARKRSISTPISTESTKCNPNQLMMKDTPEGFDPTKRAFFRHIQLLWGLIYQKSVPIAPDYSMLKEFNTRFSFNEELSNSIQSPKGIPLIPESEILTLRGAKPGKKKISNGIINLKDFYIRYVQALLAKLGIRRWAPDLNDASDTLYNEACRISVIQTFRQLASAGAYEYMNINTEFLNSLNLLEATYNHYVHYYMAQKFKKEAKESGKNQKDAERGAILRNRLRLKNLRYRFGVAQGFPQRYLNILGNIDAHSDDEKAPGKKTYFIKKMKFRSQNATIFMRRVDEEIEKAEEDNGKSGHRRLREVPPIQSNSIGTRVPKRLPIDFYDPEWYNSRTAGKKTISADTFNVAFLPDASMSIRGNQHPDEKLNDRRFSEKYWDQLIEPYDISHEIQPDDEDVESESNTSAELARTSSEEDIDSSESDEENDEEYIERNSLLDQDTEMAHAPDPNVFAVGSSNDLMQTDWSRW
ncbi:hypothetical protein O181_082520 [Austropuccinia psidii MF-1]|uniref:Uncharacterized protein n=1 Tax=Austropuccinia psidii MF-1 TaxID=1389203 RepID=A0A9Q3FLA4_9BASI|nr:hypothetical protein [Austropuccinia psidii MF-1]